MTDSSTITSPGQDTLIRAFTAASVDRLCARLDEVVPVVLEAVAREVPEYRQLASPERAGVEAGIRANAERFLRLLAEDRGLDPSDVEAVEAFAMEAARRGIPLASVQEAARAGMQAGFELVADDVKRHATVEGAPDPLEILHANAARVIAFVHGVHEIVGNAYRAVEREPLAVVPRSPSEFVDRLVEGTWTDDDTIATRAREAGTTVSSPCGLVVLVALDGDPATVTETVDALSGRLPSVTAGSVRRGRHTHAPALLSFDSSDAHRLPDDPPAAWGRATAALATLARDRGVVAFAERLERPSDVAASYRGICGYLGGLDAGLGFPGLVAGWELTLLAACGHVGRARALHVVRDALGGLLSDLRHQPLKYLQTLDALGSRPDKKDAARILGVKLSTLHDRIARIRDYTGFDPNIPADACRLLLAVHLYRAHSHALPALGDPSWRAS